MPLGAIFGRAPGEAKISRFYLPSLGHIRMAKLTHTRQSEESIVANTTHITLDSESIWHESVLNRQPSLWSPHVWRFWSDIGDAEGHVAPAKSGQRVLWLNRLMMGIEGTDFDSETW